MLQGLDEHTVIHIWFPAPGDSVGSDSGRVLPFGKFTKQLELFTHFVSTKLRHVVEKKARIRVNS